jgi:hypothetical protein
MMTLILYDNWMQTAREKVRVTGKDGRLKMVPRLTKVQIKGILEICEKAYYSAILTNGILYQIK